MEFKKINLAFKKTIASFNSSIPLLVGILLLLGIAQAVIPETYYGAIFTGNIFYDPLIGATIGSFMAGNPITSYLIGGEFLGQGISMIAVTAFILSWVTVGLIQMPVEMMMMGKRFALFRNFLAFVSAIIIAFLVEISLRIFT